LIVVVADPDRWMVKGRRAVDIVELQRRVEAVEAAVATHRASEKKLSDELDRLAEHLIGENAPELHEYKQRIQSLAIRIDPHTHAASEVEIYLDTYCRHR
jgi:allophanate hydrolase subunit 1